jgi:hypothetical protein
MRPHRQTVLAFITAAVIMSRAWAQDPRELVRRSIAQDQLDWVRMKDYTWQANSVERYLDAHGKVESTKRETWETLIIDGRPHRRMLERDGKPLSAEEQRSEQKKIDREISKVTSESAVEKQRNLEETEKRRKREFAFLSEIPDLFDLRLEDDATLDGRRVWVVSGAPRNGAQPKSRDAKMLTKVRGRMWIDKATYQWARVEAETTDTISWGLFLARLNAGSRLLFEQTEVSPELWLPKRLVLTGSGRIGLVKRLAKEEEVQWTNYKKFSVDSKVVTGPLPSPRN